MDRSYIHLELAIGLDDWYALRQCTEHSEVKPPHGLSFDKRRDRRKNNVYAAFLLRPLLQHFPCYLNGSTLIIFTGAIGLPLSTAAGCLGVYITPPQVWSNSAHRGTFFKPTLSLSHNRWLLPSPLNPCKSPRLPQTLLPIFCLMNLCSLKKSPSLITKTTALFGAPQRTTLDTTISPPLQKTCLGPPTTPALQIVTGMGMLHLNPHL